VIAQVHKNNVIHVDYKVNATARSERTVTIGIPRG